METDIIVVTNKPNRMLNYRRGIFDDAPIYQVVGIDNKSDPYGMTWAHRDIATKAMAEGETLEHACAGYLSVSDLPGKRSSSRRKAVHRRLPWVQMWVLQRKPWRHGHEGRDETCAVSAGNYTAFMYVEDDVLVRWETMVAWAEDDALLAPFGFQRGFFRVESNFQSGACQHPAPSPALSKWCFLKPCLLCKSY